VSRAIVLPFALSAALGCSTRPPKTVDVAGTGGHGIGETTSETPPADSGADGDKLDVGPSATGGNGGDGTTGGCQKIDFLFIVDNSLSMGGEQENLRASFPAFMHTIEETMDASFFHIMVVSTDDGYGLGYEHDCSGSDCTCTPAPLCCENACGAMGIGMSCFGHECDELPITECDRSAGTGRTMSAEGVDCALDGDRRYLLHTQPDLNEAFECVATVGTAGAAGEKPMLAMIEALSDEHNAAGGCNEGFLRDDAILVVTVITDEEDDDEEELGPAGYPGSPGNPPDWVDAVVAAKGGDPNAVVFLALVGDGNLDGGQCVGEPMNMVGAEPAPRLQAVADALPFGVVGSVCAPNYDPFFENAVEVIDASCQMFDPVG